MKTTRKHTTKLVWNVMIVTNGADAISTNCLEGTFEDLCRWVNEQYESEKQVAETIKRPSRIQKASPVFAAVLDGKPCTTTPSHYTVGECQHEIGIYEIE